MGWTILASGRLADAAAGSLMVLAVGSLAARLCRQPVRRGPPLGVAAVRRGGGGAGLGGGAPGGGGGPPGGAPRRVVPGGGAGPPPARAPLGSVERDATPPAAPGGARRAPAVAGGPTPTADLDRPAAETPE